MSNKHRLAQLYGYTVYTKKSQTTKQSTESKQLEPKVVDTNNEIVSPSPNTPTQSKNENITHLTIHTSPADVLLYVLFENDIALFVQSNTKRIDADTNQLLVLAKTQKLHIRQVKDIPSAHISPVTPNSWNNHVSKVINQYELKHCVTLGSKHATDTSVQPLDFTTQTKNKDIKSIAQISNSLFSEDGYISSLQISEKKAIVSLIKQLITKTAS